MCFLIPTKINTQDVSLTTRTEHGGKSTTEGAQNGVERHERMKRGNGMKDRDERSCVIESRVADAFSIINPTATFIRNQKHMCVYFQQNKKGEGGQKGKNGVTLKTKNFFFPDAYSGGR